ncbi:probable serine/threonine-protein kinase clkA [Parasteatoda tepidariorum]|uniref:probable serine/threonine-protein kinase clkA n=1 Tax=Parasteatoda tepidariorum TaxID=114398 RepID=UPI001C723E10|nr:GATA zinc finger domain-containing protein 14 [Parasteatoda tepidariorum]
MQLNIRPWDSLIQWNCIQLLPSLENLVSNLKFFRDNYLILVLLSVFYNYVIYEFFDVNLLNNAVNVATTICIVVTHACFYNRPQLPSGGIVNGQDNLSRSDDTLTETNQTNHQTRQCFYGQNKGNIGNSCNNSNRSQNFPSSNFNYSRFRNRNVSDDDVNDQDDFNRPNNTLSYPWNQTQTMYQLRNRRNVENFNSTRHRKSPSPNSNEFRNHSYKNNKNHRNFTRSFENHSANSQSFARFPKFPKRRNINKYKKNEQDYDSNLNWGCVLSILLFCFIAYIKINEVAIKPPQITSFNSTNFSCVLS